MGVEILSSRDGIRLGELRVELQRERNEGLRLRIELLRLQIAHQNPARPVAAPRRSAVATGASEEIDQLLGEASYPLNDEAFTSEWITISQAVNDFCFADSEWVVRRWCEEGSVYCRQKPGLKKKVWQLCPKSAAILIGLGPGRDPRLPAKRTDAPVMSPLSR